VRRLAVLAALVLLVGPAEARTLKGNGPVSLAVGYGAVWIGSGDGTVTRVDARTLNKVERRLSPLVAGFYIGSLASGFGSIWVAPNSTPLHRLDPRTGAVQAKVSNQPGRWSGSASLVATGAGFVWAGDYQRNAIFRVDARTNRIGRRKSLPHRLRGLVAGAGGVWVQTIPGRGPITGPNGPRIVSRVDPQTLRVHRAFRTDCDASLQPAGRSLWVLDNCDGALRRFDVRTGTLGDPIETSPGAFGLTSGFGSVWVSDGSTVRRVHGGRVAARIPVRGPILAAGDRFVWVLDVGDGVTGWLRRIDPSTNHIVGRPIRLAGRR
jgi:streptogramin lyase